MTSDERRKAPGDPAIGPAKAGLATRGCLMVLPDGADDGALAVKQLEHAIEASNVTLVLVLGGDERAAQIVEWACRLCGVGPDSPDAPGRRVVWVRDPEIPEIGVFLAMLLWLPLPKVAVLNSRSWVRARLEEGDEITPEALEQAFLKGQEPAGEHE